MRLGQWGEKLAADYLEQRGYTCRAKNVRIGAKEIDLVMERDDLIVFVEVKTRATDSFGLPEASLGTSKRQHLIEAAWGYLEQVDRLQSAWRYDVIAIEVTKAREVIRLDHYPAAFDIDST
jgi:putative endonuclease